MSDAITNYQTEQSGVQRGETKRSSSYPALTVLDAFAFASRINNHFSATTTVTREEIAKAFEIKNSNSISREVAACSQYNLLSKEPDGYKLTALFTDILRPESDKHKKIDLIKAFGSPKLYQELIKKFDGQTIPQELSNTLIKHHGITENASKDTAKIFINSAKEVGVLNDSRLLQYEVTLSYLSKSLGYTQINDDDDEVQEDTKALNTSMIQVNSSDFMEVVNSDDKKIPIHLTNNKIAYLSYPNSITENDVALIEHELKGIILRLKFEKADTNKNTTQESMV